ncbi:MAG: hypothetical protein LQ340_005895, partial [Diploschistes diacapsis]
MGVTGLWTILSPLARPTPLPTLNKKRLAVDASIWIYQFLKAVRDKEGHALRNSHVVGFFRRICKLLFHGIRPVFVFDGAAPLLKRETVAARRRRREGRREDVRRTAVRLVAVQMGRREEEERERERRKKQREGEEERERNGHEEEEEEVPDADKLVYVEEIGMTEQERRKNRGFKKKDQYHLPDIDGDFATLGAPDDPRVMSQEELEEYARQFHSGEDINLYDFSKIDFDSPFFVSLPASDRYNILNAARLRSRLRMGYSKEQLDTMFPDRMAFSRFQIDRVRERNELTQRLMNLNGMNGEEFNVNGRIAGEKGKEYVLVKNDGVEGGWVLGVVSNKNEGKRERPIDVDKLASSQLKKEEGDEWEDEEAFEDVPIEGLNRLPKPPTLHKGLSSSNDLERRRDFYLKKREEADSGRPAQKAAKKPAGQDQDSLFVQQTEGEEDGLDDLFEDVMPNASANEEDEDLRRAIAMSLEQDESVHEQAHNRAAMLNGPDITKPLEYNQKNAKAGRAFAHATNSRANNELAGPFAEESDEEVKQPLPSGPKGFIGLDDMPKPRKEPPSSSQNSGFNGPLPFESLNLGKSLLGKKKKKKQQDEEGGFEKGKEKKAEPLPPWFSANLEQSYATQKAIENRDREFDRKEAEKYKPAKHQPILHREQTNEVIDLEAPKAQSNEVIEVESSEESDENVEIVDERTVDDGLRMGDMAEKIRAEPPETRMPKEIARSVDTSELRESWQDGGQDDEEMEWSESDLENEQERRRAAREAKKPAGGEIQMLRKSFGPEFEDIDMMVDSAKQPHKSLSPEFEDVGMARSNGNQTAKSASPEFENVDITTIGGEPTAESPSPEFEDVDMTRSNPKQTTESASPDFESVDITTSNGEPTAKSTSPEFENIAVPNLQESPDPAVPSLPQGETLDEYSDPEDEELMIQLAAEASEHARFATSLTSQPQQKYTAEDYEQELKQLRTQQKKDRRDADEVTQIMITECQQLLKLFGLPYITAPMEAEAQCAELVSLGLVDGIVTDDSDIFLFGGTRVYKNMFNQAKFVECYLASDLEKEYSLTREKVIQVAHLLGSDYTEGLPHVGPVTAMEILSEFPSLASFRDWYTALQIPGGATSGDDPQEQANSPFRRKFRKYTTKLFLPPNFPDPRVDDAYLHPDVDSDPSEFAWGVPDLDALRGFLMATIGWSQQRADEILVPVIRDMNRRETEGTQANITRFFGGRVGSGTVVVR